MHYVVGPFMPPVCYLLVPPMGPFLQSSPSLAPAPSDLPQENAEITLSSLASEDQIRVSREDLLREGYDRTKRAWSEEEDNLLMQLCKNQNARFDEIAKHIEGRNSKMCYSRYRRLTHQSKNCWSKSENRLLEELVGQLGHDGWQEMASYFPGRNHKQLKDHYQNYLRPDLSKEEWTLEEDLELIELYNRYGKDWQVIQNRMAHRSRNQIKNRFFGRILRLDAKKKEGKSLPIKEQAFAFPI